MNENERETGVEEARKVLGPLVNDAAVDGTVTYLTRRGRRFAAIVPLDRIKERTMQITEVTALVPTECSRATAATAWRAVAINRGFEVNIVGKDSDDNPLVRRGGDPFNEPDSGSLYVLVQEHAGIVRAEPFNHIAAYEQLEPVRNECPADNCDYGDVDLTEWRDEGGTVVRAGACDSCAQESVECPDCEALTVLFDGAETPCETGCGAVFQKDRDCKGLTVGFRRIH